MNMFQPTVSIPHPSATRRPYSSEVVGQANPFPNSRIESTTGVFAGLWRRLRRERRRRKVGRAYDMALEVARVIPLHSSVIDVGCGKLTPHDRAGLSQLKSPLLPKLRKLLLLARLHKQR